MVLLIHSCASVCQTLCLWVSALIGPNKWSSVDCECRRNVWGCLWACAFHEAAGRKIVILTLDSAHWYCLGLSAVHIVCAHGAPALKTAIFLFKIGFPSVGPILKWHHLSYGFTSHLGLHMFTFAELRVKLGSQNGSRAPDWKIHIHLNLIRMQTTGETFHCKYTTPSSQPSMCMNVCVCVFLHDLKLRTFSLVYETLLEKVNTAAISFLPLTIKRSVYGKKWQNVRSDVIWFVK